MGQCSPLSETQPSCWPEQRGNVKEASLHLCAPEYISSAFIHYSTPEVKKKKQRKQWSETIHSLNKNLLSAYCMHFSRYQEYIREQRKQTKIPILCDSYIVVGSADRKHTGSMSGVSRLRRGCICPQFTQHPARGGVRGWGSVFLNSELGSSSWSRNIT